MALSEPNGILPTNMKTTIEPKLEPELERPLANFPLSIWGDMFLSFSLDNSQLEAYEKAMEQPKEQLRTLILNPAIDSNEKLSLIYSVYRLGLSYLFSEDIYSQLDKLFDKLNLQDYREADLYTTSIHFQVFRNFGYRFPSDVFNNFKDCSSGEFKEDITTDARGLISFYESAQLRIRGESILDEADVFTQTHLKTLVKALHGTLERQVKHVLERPFNRGLEMVEARKYLVNFEKESSRYDSLLTLAKVHFNYLQLLQKEELRIISKWWKDLGMPTYVRDRAPEIYVWILALYLEPCYSQARIIATKVLLLVVVLDDTYDAYATIEEMRLLTNAINRWDITAVSQLPEYVRPFYEIILNEYAEFHKQLPEHETRDLIIDASKRAFQDLARAYHQEAEWRHSGEVPLYEEYMKTGLITSAHGAISIAALVGMGKILTKEAFAWYDSYPNMEKTSQLIGRLGDDIMSIEFERERGPIVTSVETYMKTFGVSQNVAMEALKNIVDDAWKDINEGCLKPTVVSMGVLAPLVNLTRMIDVGYRYNDGFTFPEKTLKEYIMLLFCESVAM